MIHLPSMRQLRYLDALDRERHFGRAAERCFVSQSTLSAGIKELEQNLGVVLVDRSGRSVLFTNAGRHVLTRARRVLREAEELVEAARVAGEPLSGAVRMGVIPTIAPFFLPRILPLVRKKWPQLQLFLSEDQTARLVSELHDGQLDLLLLALPCDYGPAVAEPLFDDTFRLACPPDHPLAALDQVDARNIDPDGLLLLSDGHCLREHALDACRLFSGGRARAFAATSLHTLVQMVDNGLGVTLLPEVALASGILEGTSLVTRPLLGERTSREIGLVWRRESPREPDFRLLAGFLREASAV